MRVDITGGFDVQEENDNGRRVIDFCAVTSTRGWLKAKMECR